MTLKYILPCLAVLFIVGACHNSMNSDEHDEKHDTAGGHAHSGGHHVGTLGVSSPIIKDTTYYDTYVCQIRAHQHIELKALEEGYLEKVLVDEGEVVKKGQLLFEIQPTIYLAEIQKAKAEVSRSEAERKKAQIEVKNLQALVNSNIISINELALAQAELQKEEAHLANAKAELNLMEVHLQFTKIRAPFSGRIGRFEDIRVGSLLEQGEELTTLTDNREIWVYFNVPEAEYLAYVQSPEEESELELQLANKEIFDHKGKVTAVQAVFDNTTGTLPFRATFQNPKRLLRHGQTGNILWPNKLHETMFIPQKATFEILEKRYVFVVDEEGHVSSREINISAELNNVYAISEGLTIDDKFLLEGLRKVKDGDKIEYNFIDPDEVFHSLDLHAE